MKPELTLQYTCSIEEGEALKASWMQFAAQMEPCVILDSCDFYSSQHPTPPHHRYKWLIGAGATHRVKAQDWSQLKTELTANYWWFGYLDYDMPTQGGRNKKFKGTSVFFSPEIVWIATDEKVEIWAAYPIDLLQLQVPVLPAQPLANFPLLHPQFSKAEYLKRIQHLQYHIQRGDIYEINFCQSFKAEVSIADPFLLWKALTEKSAMPFSGFFASEDTFILSASPERYLYKAGQTVVSQPMKGTVPVKSTPEENAAQIYFLKHDGKETAENVMIVDLVRNDLSRIALRNSVKVTELFGVYPYRHVFQMISTVEATVEAGLHPVSVLEAAFPMGSMTGAPKLRSMELIDETEEIPRGAFSGSLGYITPQGDFDFNVMIRSLFYAAHTRNLQLHVGSAITALANAEQEYEECWLKIAPLIQVLGGNPVTYKAHVEQFY